MKLADNDIIPAVLAKIENLETRAARIASHRAIACKCAVGSTRPERYTAAADRLRDFATIELLCEGLGITREEALS